MLSKQSTAFSFKTRLTCPICAAFVSASRYTYKSAASSAGVAVSSVPYKNSCTLRSTNGRSAWLQLRTARPTICSMRFMLYHGSMMCTWRTFLKSMPSLPALEMMTTLIRCPCSFSVVSASNSARLSGDSCLSPVNMAYLAANRFGFWFAVAIICGTGAVLNKDPTCASYRLNPISSSASAMGTAPPPMYSL